MLFCRKCEREVVIYGVSYSEGIRNNLNETREKLIVNGRPGGI